jgi:hypothetical protein
MAGSYTFPALAASMLMAVAGGIHLGHSAIALINPIHFQGPAIHPRDRGAAIDEPAIRPTEPHFASLYGWTEGRSARALDCGDCEALAARDAYADYPLEPVVIHRAVSYGLDEPLPSEEADASGDPWFDEGPAAEERIERYAYYQIEADASDDEGDESR